ncbi:MAG: CDP-diacylglycerol--glycerol-3-phosphate 3-phosphatidyltransferase [Solirubrobacterales bacterium]|nr:CDP-diacylglycerol--glycerol-3-phosphate 3-phosphatidyltransferase [Solirubrobacterales bacterium]
MTHFLAATTVLRILLTPVIMGLVLAGDETVAAVLFAAAAFTDFCDGYLARRFDATTTLGSFLDTTADKLLTSGVLIALVAAERGSPWIVSIIVGRELMILGLRGLVATSGYVVAPSPLGKSKTVVQFVAILLAIVRPGEQIAGAYLDEWAMVIAAVVTAWSGADYLMRFRASLRAA